MNLRDRLHQGVALTMTLALLWLMLSGHYSALLLTLGGGSVLLCVWIASRMQVRDAEMHPGQFRLHAVIFYLMWLIREVSRSAWDVARRILAPSLPISPTVVRLPISQRTDVGRSIYANSITLTPGTVSIDLGDDYVEVHALTRESAQGLASGEMDARVSALERRS